MTKSELADRIAEQNPHLYAKDAAAIVDAIFDTIADALARRDRVELRGFGSCSVKVRPARNGRNPKSGAAVAVEEKHATALKAGKGIRVALNASG